MDQREMAKKLKEGYIFICPGNEAYEIMCNSGSEGSIKKMLDAGIEGTPSLVVHDKKWLCKNLAVNEHYIEKLPGPFTFVARTRKGSKVPKQIKQGELTMVRMTDNEITRMAAKKNIMLFSYVLKKKGKMLIDPNTIPRSIKKIADEIIDGGILEGKPHVVIDLTGKIAKIIK